MSQPVRRLLALFVLLPQLLMLGLGQGVVVCIAPSGHLGLELSSSACCDSPSGGSAGEETSTVSDSRLGATDCGSCSDLAMAIDPRVSSDRQEVAFAAYPVAASPAAPAVAGPGPRLGRARPARARRSVEPLHLGHLRSVVLHC